MNQTDKAKYRILIVDDEPAVREFLADLLQAPNRTIQLCENPKSAVEWLTNNAADLALLDLMMPGMNGFELANHIKQKYPETHIVICTGYLAEDYSAQASSNHVERILQKPFNLGEVLQFIEKYNHE